MPNCRIEQAQLPIRSERPKRPKSVSAETEISAKLTETSAEISAEILPKITWKFGYFFQRNVFFLVWTYSENNFKISNMQF